MRDWTEKEKNYMTVHYADTSTKELADELNRSESSVYNMAQIMSLKKSAQHLQKFCRLKKGHKLGLKTQFKKGHQSHNKGKRIHEFMSAQGLMNARKTQFKKGNRPHNTIDEPSAISIRYSKSRPYKYIKIALGVWRELHLVLWEHHNGSIPKGHNIQFRDGNSLNCVIENLYLINKSDNMKKNTIHRFPEPVKTAIKSLAKFKREIKSYEKQD